MAELRGMNDRIKKLREISVTTPVHIDLERAKIETDFYKENDGKYCIRCAEGKKDTRDKVLKVGGTVLGAVATLAVTIVGTVASIIDTSDKKE